MKKRILHLGCALALLVSTNLSANAMGLFYTDAHYPVLATGATTTKDLSSLKRGESSTMNVLFVAEWGDAGIRKAASDAGIKKISFIDINEKTVFFFFRKITTTVYGE